MSDKTIWQQLAEPFPADVVKSRQGPKQHQDACTKQYGQCTQRHMMLSYVDARDVAERLDAVLTPAGWGFEARAVPNTNVVHGALFIRLDPETPAALREDHGYPNSETDEEPLKAATSDALKRCAVLFGIGRHLYDDNHPTRPAPRPRTAPAPRRMSEQEERNLQTPTDESYPWDGMGTLPEQAAEIFAGDIDESQCPTHNKAWRTNSKGYYCASKVGDGWCKQQPSKAWQARHEMAPA